MNTILWIIAALLAASVPASYIATKFNNHYIEAAFWEFGDDTILIRFTNRFLGLTFIVACAVLWPIAYPVLMTRCYVKYRKARKQYLKEQKYQEDLKTLTDKWLESKVAC